MDLQQTIYVKIYFVSLLYSIYCECALYWDSNMFLSSIVLASAGLSSGILSDKN